MDYANLRVPATSGGAGGKLTLNRRWGRRGPPHYPGFGPLHDAVWTPEGWRRSAMVRRLSLRGCLIARRLAGDKREVETDGYATVFSTIRLWPDRAMTIWETYSMSIRPFTNIFICHLLFLQQNFPFQFHGFFLMSSPTSNLYFNKEDNLMLRHCGLSSVNSLNSAAFTETYNTDP